MVLNKKITSKIWDNCSKQIVDGYVFVKFDDIIKTQIVEEDKEDLVITKEDLELELKDINMDQVATYLNGTGWIFERNPDTGDIWRRKIGDHKNRIKIN
jgi:hypothetical protein|tara:strand:+ start:325 stop:621 length:297 start_codon:yes stop_codon:yes gene_type:complete